MEQPQLDGDPHRGRSIGVAPGPDWLETLCRLVDRRLEGILVTVIGVAGSAPREPGAKMVITSDAVHGTVGGGRLEFAATAAARHMLATGAGPSVRRIELGAGLGQCCGGAVTLLFEPIAAATWPGGVRGALRRGRACVIATVVASVAPAAAPVGARLVVAGGEVTGDWRAPALEAGALRAARDMPAAGGVGAETTVVDGHTLVLERLDPEPMVVLFGAGHVGRALVSILGTLPCTVTWVDERAEQFPTVMPHNVRAEPTDGPEDEVGAAPADACFVVMTHDHRRDLAIVERVLGRGDFAYLGMIGSVAKRRRFAQRLGARGIAPDAIARLRCPIGLAEIPGKHPGAVAVSVAAELLRMWGTVALRAGVP